MRSVHLGERTVTAAGSGDLSLAISAARGVDRRDTERALTVALELGLTLVDVHPGEDDAERLAGEVIRALRLRDAVVAAVTLPLLGGRDTPMDRLPPAYLQSRVEAALRHTKLDAIPLVQLPLQPAWPRSKVWAEIEGTCARLVREGKVLAWGARIDTDVPAPPLLGAAPVVEPAISGAWVSREPRVSEATESETEPQTIREAFTPLLAVPWLVSLSLPYNLCARAVEPLVDAATAPVPLGPEAPPPPPVVPTSSLILSPFAITAPPIAAAPRPARRTAPLAVLARHPLAGGALAGELAPGRKLAQRDDRTDIDPRALDQIALEIARLAPLVRIVPPAATSTDASRAMLERVKKREHVGALTLAELALRYVIDRGAIALPRLHRHALVTDVFVAASAEPLPPAALAWILDERA